MAATTTERNTTKHDFAGVALPARRSAPIAANTKLLKGTIAMLNAAGYLVAGTADATFKTWGVVMETVDNTGGANGAKQVPLEVGIFGFNIGAAADALAQADWGANVYVMDNQTVGKTDGTGTRAVAGKLIAIDGSQAFVQFS